MRKNKACPASGYTVDKMEQALRRNKTALLARGQALGGFEEVTCRSLAGDACRYRESVKEGGERTTLESEIRTLRLPMPRTACLYQNQHKAFCSRPMN